MKIVRLLGGLGNQMFQYAFSLGLKEAFPQEQIFTDASLFRSYRTHNGLELERVFGIELDQAPVSELRRLTWYTPNYTLMRIFKKVLPTKQTECREAPDYTFNETILTDPGDRIFCGYWQNHHYFDSAEEKIRKAFQFPNPNDNRNIELVEQLKSNSGSTSIHVRRGDYLKAPNYAGLCDLNYYKSAIEKVIAEVENPSFYIFSDDMNFCLEQIHPLLKGNPVSYIDWNCGENSFYDMYLMSLCRINIIANSSFSWWAAYLNILPSQRVYAPKKWTNTKINCKFQMPDWQLL